MNEPKIKILNIGEVEGATVINRIAALRAVGKNIHVDVNVRAMPDVFGETVGVVVTASYISEGKLLRERLLTCSAYTTFCVENLRDYVEIHGEDVIIDGNLMLKMLNITVGALRGIISIRTNKTALSGRPLPIIDLNALMYRLCYGS